VIAAALSLTIQAAALTAPFVHAHRDPHGTDRHHGTTVHAHWTFHGHSHAGSPLAAVEAGDQGDSAVYLNAFVAVAASSLPALAPASDAFELPVPDELAAHKVVDVVHSHDPPLPPSLAARAPPRLPVLI
jgi:hypothetical protein